jgi:sugar phosphate isomerase/epimerase
MSYNRRDFLKLSGGAVSALAFTAPLGSSLFSTLPDDEKKKLKAFGLQLWTLRSDLPKDPKGVLKQVASFGYKQVESFEGGKGMFWGMTNTEFKKYMDELGMKIISSHCDINKDFEKKADEAAAIGMKYLLCPYLGPQKTADIFKQKAELFNKCGETCKKAGIRFGYHNHDYGFVPVDGQLPQDILMQNTDPSLVDFEMDMYWVVIAGQDPEAWIKKYPNRFKLCHVKDRAKGSKSKDDSCTLGKGSIDYPKILKFARQHGMEYYIVEQEKYEGTTPLESAKDDAAYLKKISI